MARIRDLVAEEHVNTIGGSLEEAQKKRQAAMEKAEWCTKKGMSR